MRATLSAASVSALVDEVEASAAEAAQQQAAPDRLAGEGEALRIHEPAVDPTLAERIRIPLGRDDVYADIYIRECDGTACAIYSGEVVATIDDQLSRHGAISEAVRTLYQYFMGTGEQSKKILAGRLNAYIANTIDDPTKIVPAGESCEWPVVDEDNIDDEEPADSDINADGDVVCEGDVDDGSAVNSELADESLVAPEGEPAIEIPALAEEACGEEGESLCPPPEKMGIVETAFTYELPGDALNEAKARTAYDHALARAKDLYVAASQHRVELQANVKAAKDEEAERLEEINKIERRGWQAFLPPKKSAPTATGDSSAAGPSIPSPPSTLPPPSPESATPSSPQAGAAHAATSEAHAVNGPAYRTDWESVDIAELKLPKGTTTILREAGCGTMGALEKKRGSFDGLTSIAGIGETKRDAIEEAVLGWLSKNRDASTINAVREANHRAAVEGEGLALEMAAQGQ